MLDTKSELGVASRAAALCSVFPGAAEGRVLIADRQVGRGAALRAGWNDAAWGQPRREVEATVGPWYERGYAGSMSPTTSTQSQWR